MSFMYRARTLAHALVLTDTDRVIAWCPIPRGGKLMKSGLEISCMGGETTVLQASMWGIAGKVIPLIEPDIADIIDDIWDLLVSKAKSPILTAAGTTIDINATTADTNPEFQMQENHWEEMFNMGLDVNEFMQHREWVSFPKRPHGFRAVDAAVDQYIPSGYLRKLSRTQLSVERPSYAMIGFSSVATGNTQTSVSTLNAEQRWGQLQYLEDTVMYALQQLLGNTEAGAIGVFSDAAALIEEVTRPPALEEVAASFVAQSWNVFASAFFDIEVPGHLAVSRVGDE